MSRALRIGGLVGVSAAILISSSCTLLWLFNNDPAGLPCDFQSDAAGACLDGYVCVNVEDGDPDTNDLRPVCVKVGTKGKNETCARNEECSEGLLCASGYDQCDPNLVPPPDDIICDLVTDDQKAKACRPKCDIGDATSCPSEERCFVKDVGSICQTGVCATDDDCNTGNNHALCVGENGRGKTGLCFETCKPLDCANRSCPDCKGTDGAVNADTTCILALDEGSVPSLRTTCSEIGDIADYDPCTPGVDLCQFNAFCHPQLGICTPWCTFPTGAPACADTSATCQPTANGALEGFCLRP